MSKKGAEMVGGKIWTLLLITGCLLFSYCSILQSGAAAEIKKTGYVEVSNIFGNHMVLQQNQPIPIWGTSEPGTRVIVKLDYKKHITHTDESGHWSLELPAMKPGGPHEIVIIGKNILRFTDIYIGDVWVCSGQSNMEWPVSQSDHAEEEIAAANYSGIRLLHVERNIANHPLSDIHTNGWQICSPKTIANFSAVGYFFGREINQKAEIPIGLIHTSWGGTVAEAWTSQTGLNPFPEFSEAIQQLEDDKDDSLSYQDQQKDYQQALQDWINRLDGYDQGFTQEGLGWADPHLFADDWSTAKLPGLWENTEIGNYDGIVWYRKAISIPDVITTDQWKLSLGPIDDIDQTWINGIRIGGMEIYNQPREYEVPKNIVQPGTNVIVVRVIDHHGGGGFWGSEAQMTLTNDQGDLFPLAGEWLYKLGASQDQLPPIPNEVIGMENVPTVLFNAMLSPIIPFGIRGVIWYQGESNAGRAYQYRTLFPALINDWRSHWQQEFEFYFVQLANYMASHSEPTNSQWAELREAQLMTLDTPQTGMAVTIDIGEAEDIHPRNKQDVGKRLARIALAKVYDQDVIYSGPVYRSMVKENNKIRLLFDHANGGLVAKDKNKLKGFAIAGEDQKFLWANAVIDGESILVSSPLIQKPVAVRYAWADNPICNLYNKSGLPASPFRTDDWPGLTWPDSSK
ncbi:sialate O-acetylesterase [bacterium]